MRVSFIDSNLGPNLPTSIVADIFGKRATRVSLHGNRVKSLELTPPNSHSKDKHEQAIRGGAFLEHLLDLDLSSNSLHEGNALPHFGVAKRVSLLGITSNLRKLNLSSNGLTEKSFGALLGGTCLARLDTLNLSNNNLSRMPALHSICPQLKHLVATNNSIKSLTSLLQALHGHRGKLETVQFANGGTGGSASNPVCSKELYREKTMFVLGSTLVRLDREKISASERERTMIRLERGLCDHTGNGLCASSGQERMHREHPASRQSNRMQQTACDRMESGQNAGLDYEENGVQGTLSQQCIESHASDEKIKALEEQVARLSALVEKQVSNDSAVIPKSSSKVHGARTRKEGRYQHNNDSSPNGTRRQELSTRKPSREKEKDTKSHDAERCQRQKHEAIFMLKALLIRKKHTESTVHLVLSLWVISTRFARHIQISKANCANLDKSWQAKAAELVEECNRKLEISEETNRTSAERIMHLSRELGDLKGQLEHERECRKKEEWKFQQDSDALKTDVRRLETSRKVDGDELEERARLAEAKLDGLRAELRRAKEDLEAEQVGRTELESANDEAKKLANVHAARLHRLKLEAAQKDATIQRLKDAYEQAARACSRQAATDKSRLERAMATEEQTKDSLRKQTNALRDVETEMERIITENKSRHSKLQNQLRANESKVSSLSGKIEEKERKICTFERRLDSIAEDRDEVHKQLVESNRMRSRMEERYDRLRAQLDEANDDRTTAKQHSVDKNILDAEMSKNIELRQSFIRLRQSSDQQEFELRARIETTHLENTLLREDVATHQTLAKSLGKRLQMTKSEGEAREKQILRSHRDELRRLQDKNERELTSAKNEIEAERSLRLELEKKASALEAENGNQKLKMQNAIEGLAKQLVCN